MEFLGDKGGFRQAIPGPVPSSGAGVAVSGATARAPAAMPKTHGRTMKEHQHIFTTTSSISYTDRNQVAPIERFQSRSTLADARQLAVF